MYYFAQAYSHPDPIVREERFKIARYAALIALEEKVPFNSPILHWHPVAIAYSTATDHGSYMVQNEAQLRLSSGLLVFDQGEVTSRSTGVQWEISVARKLGLPIWFNDTCEGLITAAKLHLHTGG